MYINTDNSNTAISERLIVLKPMALGKWMLVLSLLLGLPFFILLEQMTNSFKSSRDQKVREYELEVEKIVGRAFTEQAPEIQLKELFSEYYKITEESVFSRYLISRSGLEKFSLPFVSGSDFIEALIINEDRLLVAKERRLRQLIPGIKLIKWDRDFLVRPGSDKILPKFVYGKLVEAICARVRQRYGNDSLNGYSDQLVLVQKFFNDDTNLVDFVKYGRVAQFHSSGGNNQFMFWTEYDLSVGPDEKTSAEGFLAVIDEEDLPVAFGLKRFSDRRKQEWEESGYALGWVDSTNADNSCLPYPFFVLENETWRRWLLDQPNGVYEKTGLLIAVRRVNSRLVLVAARSLKELDLSLQRRVFFTYLIFALILSGSFLLMIFYRRNSGVALSIRWQLLWLFVLVMALPSAAVSLFGYELLKDRRQFYENEVFKKLERVRKDVEENKDFVFRHLEIIGEEFTVDLLRYFRQNRKEPFAGEGLDQTIQHYFAKASVEHMYLFNSAGTEVLRSNFSSNERKGLLPLVTSLAKLKLRLSGKLVQDGYSGAVSLMDLMLEETGGAKLADIQAVLKTSRNSAFELKFTNRKTYFFVGEFSPPNCPDEVFIMVFIIKDRSFDQMYMKLMVSKLELDEKADGKIQMFYGSNDFSRNSYFRPTGIKSPFFRYNEPCEDSVGIGKLTEPTRFAGITVKDSYVFSNGHRFLFYSFSPIGIESCSALLLYNYSEISQKLESLKVLLVVIFLVTLLILYVLGKITARSFVEPILLLKQGVEEVEKGNYSGRLQFPGEDELVDLSLAFNAMTKGLDEREKMTRYLSRSAVEAVKTGAGAALGGRKVPASILFSDIRSFTTISESNDAETVVALLNEYFACMNEVIERHGGDIDKFIGDAIMAQFIVVPEKKSSPADMALNAVNCALAMMAALQNFNEARENAGKFPVMIGVGINSGEVIAGNIGSPGRMDHTVIGDVVNVASRLEGMSKLGQHTHVIISRSTLELVKDSIEYVRLEETSVKGKTEAVEMFEVISSRKAQVDK